MTRLLTIARRAGIAAPPGPLVSDTFDRANSTTSLGTADTGQTWTNEIGTMGINANQAYGPTAGAEVLAVLEGGASDVDITCDITHGDYTNNGLIFRHIIGSQRREFLMARLGANKVELYKSGDGAGYVLLSEVATTLTQGQTYAFRVVCFGSTIDVYVDGVKKITATEQFSSTRTQYGMYGLAGTARWDNFKVEANPPLVSDSFDRADNSTSLGAADTGQAWTTLEGTWGISANKAYVIGGGAAHLDSGAADVDVTCDITHHGDNGVVFRSVDNNNYMMARLGANKVELYRKQSNTWNLVSEVAMTMTAGQTYAFRVVASGSTIDVYVDGVKKITATESFQSTVTKHGLYGTVGEARWDNFRVEAT